jgi:hypothetical protein
MLIMLLLNLEVVTDATKAVTSAAKETPQPNYCCCCGTLYNLMVTVAPGLLLLLWHTVQLDDYCGSTIAVLLVPQKMCNADPGDPLSLAYVSPQHKGWAT